MKSLINFFLVAALPAVMVACGGAANEAEVPAEVESQPFEQPAAADTVGEEIDANMSEVNESPPAEPEEMAEEPSRVEGSDTVAASAAQTETATVAEETEPKEDLVEVSPEPDPEAIEPAAVAVEFTAATGLGDFSAYRMNFSTEFDGSRGGQLTQGTLGGLMEITRKPAAQHWSITVEGNAFEELALLGGGTEMYDVGDTIYIENPADGSFIGMPAMFVESMLPSEMYNPEDNIEMPVSAVQHPGEEVVNGIITQRYTFGRDDLANEDPKLENVEGTIWVAVDGNYVVKYEAVATGEFDNLSAGNLKVLDEGTITMVYDISDVNGDFTIGPPPNAKAINLTDLLFK
jgi:hypothetical protein